MQASAKLVATVANDELSHIVSRVVAVNQQGFIKASAMSDHILDFEALRLPIRSSIRVHLLSSSFLDCPGVPIFVAYLAVGSHCDTWCFQRIAHISRSLSADLCATTFHNNMELDTFCVDAVQQHSCPSSGTLSAISGVPLVRGHLAHVTPRSSNPSVCSTLRTRSQEPPYTTRPTTFPDAGATEGIRLVPQGSIPSSFQRVSPLCSWVKPLRQHPRQTPRHAMHAESMPCPHNCGAGSRAAEGRYMSARMPDIANAPSLRRRMSHSRHMCRRFTASTRSSLTSRVAPRRSLTMRRNASQRRHGRPFRGSSGESRNDAVPRWQPARVYANIPISVASIAMARPRSHEGSTGPSPHCPGPLQGGDLGFRRCRGADGLSRELH